MQGGCALSLGPVVPPPSSPTAPAPNPSARRNASNPPSLPLLQPRRTAHPTHTAPSHFLRIVVMSLANARKSPLAADYTNTFVATPQYNLGLHDDCPLTSCFVKKSETVRVLLKSCIKAKALCKLQFTCHFFLSWLPGHRRLSNAPPRPRHSLILLSVLQAPLSLPALNRVVQQPGVAQ